MHPVQITDPRIQEFNVWAGPGVNGAGLEDAEGFIVYWKKAAVAAPPVGLKHYEVSFYAGCRTEPSCLGERPRLDYVVVVSYDYNPSSKRGFIYLPGKGDASYSLNLGTITHVSRVEGRWFFALDSWESFVRPLIARAKASSTPGNA